MSRAWSGAAALVMALAMGAVPTGCESAGGGGGGTLPPGDADTSGGGDLVGAEVGTFDPSQCPSTGEAFATMNAATYAVVGKIRVGPNPTDLNYAFIGTAFAVGDRLLATNAHVTEAFNNLKGVRIEDVLAVQSGTGTVVKLLRALTHPDYTGDPLRSPDVGLFTSQELLPAKLTLANGAHLAALQLGDEVQITGFPGDVQDFVGTIIPGTTVPQATSLSGQITAFRNHDASVAVTPDNTDVIQHQAPTTPGTSGSAMFHCGEVVAANNAGTVQIVLVVGADGQVSEDRTAAAANNFGVHARYLHEMISLFEDNAVQGFALPPAFVPNDTPTGVAAFAGTYQGGVSAPPNAVHTLAFTVAQDGTVSGQSTWQQTGNFTLAGQVDAQGNIVFVDDANQRLGFNTGIYIGRVDANGNVGGNYAEGEETNVLAQWGAARQ